MKKYFFITICSFLWADNCFCQKIELCNYSKIEVEIIIEKGKRFKNRVEFSTIKKNEVLLSFKETFSDTIISYVDKLEFRKDFVKTDAMQLGLSNTAFKINLLKISKKQIVFLLPSEDKYLEVKLKRNYRAILIYKFGTEWRLIYTNFVPEYY